MHRRTLGTGYTPTRPLSGRRLQCNLPKGDDHSIQWCQLPDDLPGIAFGLLFDQGIDQIDGIEEASLLSLIDQGRSKRDGDVCFAGAGSTHQNEAVGVFGELPGTEGVYESPARDLSFSRDFKASGCF